MWFTFGYESAKANYNRSGFTVKLNPCDWSCWTSESLKPGDAARQNRYRPHLKYLKYHKYQNITFEGAAFEIRRRFNIHMFFMSEKWSNKISEREEEMFLSQINDTRVKRRRVTICLLQSCQSVQAFNYNYKWIKILFIHSYVVF